MALLDQARAWGVPHQGVVADADDGDTPNCLGGLEARQERSVVAVRSDFSVGGGGVATSPVWRADARLQHVPRWPWRTVRWRLGTQGWLRQKFVAVRCWRVTSDGHRPGGWLGGERATQGRPEERTYCWSHLPPDIPLEVLAGSAHRRPAIEPFHEAATGEWGWDQSQGRLWPGLHRHAVTVLLADSLLVWLERRPRSPHPRQGRRGDPFPPSAELPAENPAGLAS